MELSLLSDAKRRRATWKNNQGKLFILAGILAGILLFRLEDFDGKRRRTPQIFIFNVRISLTSEGR